MNEVKNKNSWGIKSLRGRCSCKYLCDHFQKLFKKRRITQQQTTFYATQHINVTKRMNKTLLDWCIVYCDPCTKSHAFQINQYQPLQTLDHSCAKSGALMVIDLNGICAHYFSPSRDIRPREWYKTKEPRCAHFCTTTRSLRDMFSFIKMYIELWYDWSWVTRCWVPKRHSHPSAKWGKTSNSFRSWIWRLPT